MGESFLNPSLYGKLYLLTNGNVKIVHPGDPGCEIFDEEDFTLNISCYGETYVICCPYCGDKRFRLWINYRFGTINPLTSKPILFPIKCFNEENCMNNFEIVKNFYETLQEISFEGNPWTSINPSNIKTTKFSARPTNVRTWPLKYAPAYVQHYLVEHQFDPEILYTKYGVLYGQVNQMDGLFIPVFYNHIMVGWQLRNFNTFGSARSIKYFNCPSFKKSDYLYNYDQGSKFKHIFIVEGVTDVWRCGEDSIALFGCEASNKQAELIASTWDRVFILLDGDANDKAFKLACKLKTFRPDLESKVYLLPQNKDPAALTKEEIQSIKEALLSSLQ
jgi:5S rRNA maturation endonuclease (ribonuclease M5)